MQALTQPELAEALGALPGWELLDGRLVREWRMDDFRQALSFVNQVAEISEAAGHHPDIDIRFTFVRLSLINHDLQANSRRDVKLGMAISKAFPS